MPTTRTQFSRLDIVEYMLIREDRGNRIKPVNPYARYISGFSHRTNILFFNTKGGFCDPHGDQYYNITALFLTSYGPKLVALGHYPRLKCVLGTGLSISVDAPCLERIMSGKCCFSIDSYVPRVLV
jgi:hypothetical protein